MMASCDSLAQKIARNPLRFGLIVGFLGVPILWMAGENLVRLALHQPVLRAEEFWNYEASGALIGALLGGNGARVWASCRAGQRAEARGIAILTGAGGTGFYVLTAALHAATSPFFARFWLGVAGAFGFAPPAVFVVLSAFAGRAVRAATLKRFINDESLT